MEHKLERWAWHIPIIIPIKAFKTRLAWDTDKWFQFTSNVILLKIGIPVRNSTIKRIKVK